MSKNAEKTLFFLFLLLVGVFYRFVPHPPNFSPLAAIALFGGFYYRKFWSFFLPLTILFLSDFFLGFYEPGIMLSVYTSMVLIVFLGMLVRKKKSLLTIFAGSFGGSVLFFLLTNFAVWFFGNWYAHDLAGLERCFFLALPFFRNTFLGDMFFTSVFFGLFEFSHAYGTQIISAIKKETS